MNEAERAESVRQAVQGDADALQRLIVYYHAASRQFIERKMAVVLRRHVDPDDVLQQAYIAAFQSIKGQDFSGPGGFYKWIERIALEKLKTAARRLRRKKRDIGRERHADSARGALASTSYQPLLTVLAASGDTPSRQLAVREASAAVISSLARLTDDQRMVIRMRFLEDRSPAEIAAALGKSEAAVYMLCARGLKALAGFLGSITHYLSGW